eukprot:137561-Pleurochrysis_carterae.AAC.1
MPVKAVNVLGARPSLHLHRVGRELRVPRIVASSFMRGSLAPQDVERPVHLLLDLGLGVRRMSCKAYLSKASARAQYACVCTRRAYGARTARV